MTEEALSWVAIYQILAGAALQGRPSPSILKAIADMCSERWPAIYRRPKPYSALKVKPTPRIGQKK